MGCDRGSAPKAGRGPAAGRGREGNAAPDSSCTAEDGDGEEDAAAATADGGRAEHICNCSDEALSGCITIDDEGDRCGNGALVASAGATSDGV